MKAGSPGMNFTFQGDSQIDPLRFTTKTTFAARDANVVAYAKPNHNVRYEWEKDEVSAHLLHFSDCFCSLSAP